MFFNENKLRIKILLTAILAFALSGCTTFRHIPNKFQQQTIQTPTFKIAAFTSITDANADVVFYIEGDGKITNGKNLSIDPTPQNKLVAELASLDTRPNVVYLARPCQYLVQCDELCSNKYWADLRWSPEVIEAMSYAIKQIAGNKNVHLVGFSGGGGIAVLVAAKNNYVSSIVTIAGNLDIVTFNKLHKVKQSLGSLNPADYAASISHIPQVHLVGAKDTVVPEIIATKYMNRLPLGHKASKLICKQCSHSNEAWVDFWKEFLKTSENNPAN